jgi:hypothetical protein
MRYHLLVSPLLIIVSAAIANAGLVSSSSVGQVQSTALTTTDTASSSTEPVPLNAFAAEQNSFTDSDLDYSFNAGTSTASFSGSSFAEKTVSAKPGGDHIGLVDWTFTFTVDSDTEFALNGTWGFDSNTGTNDFISYALTGPGTSVTNSITTGSTTVFSEIGVIGPGTYSLVFDMELNETINNQGTRSGAFSGAFSLTAVPEPGSLSLMVVAMLTLGCGHRRRRRVAK